VFNLICRERERSMEGEEPMQREEEMSMVEPAAEVMRRIAVGHRGNKRNFNVDIRIQTFFVYLFIYFLSGRVLSFSIDEY
jgi:hypothetical protein